MTEHLLKLRQFDEKKTDATPSPNCSKMLPSFDLPKKIPSMLLMEEIRRENQLRLVVYPIIY